jgi:hypothetical protein
VESPNKRTETDLRIGRRQLIRETLGSKATPFALRANYPLLDFFT